VSLPQPKKKAAAPSMLDLNREQEAEAARGEGMRLEAPQGGPTGRLSVAPILQATLDSFEDQYTALKRQKRSLKRYDVIEALLQAFTEDPEVQRAVIERLK